HAGGAGLFATREAQDAAALLGFLATEADDLALAAVLRSPFCAVDDRTLLRLARRAKKLREEQGVDATGVGAGLAAPAGADADLPERATQGSPLRPGPQAAAVSWWTVLDHEAAALGLESPRAILKELLTAARREPPSRLLARADALTGYTAVLANLPMHDRRLADWEGFAGWVREAERGHEDVFVLTRQLRRAAALGIDVPRPVLEARDAVALLTIHHAKGLEWPVVIVPDLARVPSGGGGKVLLDRELGAAVRFRLHDPAEDEKPFLHGWLEQRRVEREREEARRVAYVALTRARDRVLLTSPGERETKAETSCLLDVLRPGLVRLGLIEGDGLPGVTARLRGEGVAYTDERALPKLPALPAVAAAAPGRELLPPITARRLRLPVTALDEHRWCPKRFRLRHLDGHPGDAGLSEETDPEEPGGAAALGTLVHLGIERGASTLDQVQGLARQQTPSLSDEQIRLAHAMVDRFRLDPEFEPVRGAHDVVEAPVRVERPPLIFTGRVDRLGDGYVVDYKTGEHTELDHHLAQLSLYLRATAAERAYVADLRRGALLLLEDVATAEAAVERACQGILRGEFTATPAESRCARCPYRRHVVCEESAWPQAPPDESTFDSA
ncbi:MAG: PD-(D/E)XK nuclease family protein, partial [Armatimonadetes bacterium]|nr:PD-(D/E)XK nuclease family protein [Armatimonadota bacterium]